MTLDKGCLGYNRRIKIKKLSLQGRIDSMVPIPLLEDLHFRKVFSWCLVRRAEDMLGICIWTLWVRISDMNV